MGQLGSFERPGPGEHRTPQTAGSRGHESQLQICTLIFPHTLGLNHQPLLPKHFLLPWCLTVVCFSLERSCQSSYHMMAGGGQPWDLPGSIERRTNVTWEMTEIVLSRASEHRSPASVWSKHRANRQNSETERQIKKRAGIRHN